MHTGKVQRHLSLSCWKKRHRGEVEGTYAHYIMGVLECKTMREIKNETKSTDVHEWKTAENEMLMHFDVFICNCFCCPLTPPTLLYAASRRLHRD